METLTLTKHFCRRWMQRVGNWPTVEAVRHYMDHSVRVQPCQDMLLPDGTPYRVLAIYWHPELDLVIKVDTERNAAVTVLSRENWKFEDCQAAPADGAAAVPATLVQRVARIRNIFGRPCPIFGQAARRA